MWTLKTEMKPHKHTLHVAQIFDGQTAFRCLMRLWAPWGDAASQNHILNLIRANALMNITAEFHPAARTHEWRHETSRAVIIFPPHHTDKHQHHCRSSVIACFMIVWLFVFIQFSLECRETHRDSVATTLCASPYRVPLLVRTTIWLRCGLGTFSFLSSAGPWTPAFSPTASWKTKRRTGVLSSASHTQCTLTCSVFRDWLHLWYLSVWVSQTVSRFSYYYHYKQ